MAEVGMAREVMTKATEDKNSETTSNSRRRKITLSETLSLAQLPVLLLALSSCTKGTK
jgi:hypothetical protein